MDLRLVELFMRTTNLAHYSIQWDFNLKINKAYWNLITNKDRDINDIVKDFIPSCEEIVVKIMRQKDDMLDYTTKDGNEFK